MSRVMMSHMHKEGIKRFIKHIMKFSGVIRIGSQTDSKADRTRQGD